MVKNIEFVKYRKLINTTLDFGPGINAIAGTNGTCKSSILYIVGNSYKKVSSSYEKLADNRCLETIRALNDFVNPKIERLVRDSKKYNNPAEGVSGTIFTVNYYNGLTIPFRKHNSEQDFRFSIKPYYKTKGNESLPVCPVVYLGISRLLPFGEFSDDISIAKINSKLPAEYKNEFIKIFNEFTHYDINYEGSINVKNNKKRVEFSSKIDGVDSNTISAGEDNLSIILMAITTLKYYYTSLKFSNNDVESVLLIDELDSTLHPQFQRKLLNLLRDYSIKYKIQVIFTTQSYSMLNEAFINKDNIIYLQDNISNVYPISNPDWLTIKTNLECKDSDEILSDCKIPVLMEDDEARWMFNIMMNYFGEINTSFFRVKDKFELVNVKAGAEVLKSLFSNTILNSKTIGWICILDGDRETDLNQCIIALPGGKSLEEFLYEYATKLYDSDNSFWTNNSISSYGYTKPYFREHIISKHDEIANVINETTFTGKSTKGMKRELNKRFFEENKRFFEFVLRKWLKDNNSKGEVKAFYDNLGILYRKVCAAAELPPNFWIDDLLGE